MSRQKPNLLPAIFILAGVIILVIIGSLYAFSDEKDTIQGQADVNEYRVSSKVPGRVLRSDDWSTEYHTIDKGAYAKG